MALLTAVLSYLDILLRGAILAAQALAIGGIAFALLMLGPAAKRPITAATTALDA